MMKENTMASIYENLEKLAAKKEEENWISQLPEMV